MLDRIDPGADRGDDASRAMGMRGDLEVHGMRHVDDRVHLLVGEMLLEAHGARIEHAAGRHELDHVDAGGGELAHDLLAFVDAGADGRVEMRFVDRFGELGRKAGRCVGMAADDRKRGAGDLDPRAREAPFGDRVANRDHGAGVAAEVAHGGEPAARHLERMGEADGRRIRIEYFWVKPAYQGSPLFLVRWTWTSVMPGITVRLRSSTTIAPAGAVKPLSMRAIRPFSTITVECAARRLRGVDDQAAGLNGIGFGIGGGGSDQRGRAGEQMLEHGGPLSRKRARLSALGARFKLPLHWRVATRSASAAGLSVRIRLIRGKRIARPDLWRVLLWIESNATSSTRLFSTSRTGPKRSTVWPRTQRSSHFSSSSVKPK